MTKIIETIRRRCPECKSKHIVKFGNIPTKQGLKKRMRCQRCGSTFYVRRDK